jgi:hypothetical protein
MKSGYVPDKRLQYCYPWLLVSLEPCSNFLDKDVNLKKTAAPQKGTEQDKYLAKNPENA